MLKWNAVDELKRLSEKPRYTKVTLQFVFFVHFSFCCFVLAVVVIFRVPLRTLAVYFTFHRCTWANSFHPFRLHCIYICIVYRHWLVAICSTLNLSVNAMHKSQNQKNEKKPFERKKKVTTTLYCNAFLKICQVV